MSWVGTNRGITIRFILGALAIGSLCASAGVVSARVLNRDASFEYPEQVDGAVVDSSSFAEWTVTTSAGAPELRLLRGAQVASGGQALEFRADTIGSHSRSLTQDLPDLFSETTRLLVSARLRASGTAPTSGGVELRVSTAAGLPIASQSIAYDEILDHWKRFLLWPVDSAAVVPDSLIRLEIHVDNMGTDSGFRVWLDDVRIEDRGVVASAVPTNGSFESTDLSTLSLETGRASTYLTDWTIFSANSPQLTIETGAASEGAQFIRAATAPPGATSFFNRLRHPAVAGSLLDETSRYDVSAKIRHNGVAPAEAGHIWMNLFGSGFNGASQNLISRRKVGFWELSETFQTFRLAGDQPIDQLLDAQMNVLWQTGDPVDLEISPTTTTTAGSAVEIDEFRVDRIDVSEALSSNPVILLDTTRPVPTRFITDLTGTGREVNGSFYRFFLPAGLDLLDVGNDPAVIGPNGNISGNLAGIYSFANTGTPVWIEGERYEVIDVTPIDLHPADRGVGPIFFSTTLPAESRTRLFYETHWTGGPNPPVRREAEVWTRDFPTLTKPVRWLASPHWIKASDQIFWPGYLANLASFGFNAVGGHATFDGYDLPENPSLPANPGVSAEAHAFYQAARSAGFDLALSSSPFNYKSSAITANLDARSIDANDGTFIDDAGCPAYGLMDESVYQVSDSRYTEDRDRLAAWIAAVAPEFLQLDAEGFKEGAIVSQFADPNHPAGCLRCNDYLTAYRNDRNDQSLTMADALKQMGVDRTHDLNRAVVAAGGIPVENQGYYRTRTDFTYHDVWDLESLVDSGDAHTGFHNYYSNSETTGDDFRAHHALALAKDITFYPLTKPVELVPYTRHVSTYDQVNELLGSGARGLAWWPYDQMVGGALYYYGRALESMLPVENLLVQSTPLPDPMMTEVGDPTDPDPDRYELKTTAIRAGNHTFLLVSSYGRAASAYEDPFWSGPIVVSFPTGQGIDLRGDVVRLADGAVVGTAGGGESLTFEFSPGVPGARTALFQVCDNSISGHCTDGDGDLIPDLTDNCLADPNGTQVDADGDGIGNVCDPTPVPEPGFGWMLGVGLATLAVIRRRSERSVAFTT